MKKLFATMILSLLAMCASAADYSVYFQQKLPGGVPGFRSIILDEPTANAFYLYNLANHAPDQFTFDSSIVCNTTTHICSVPLTVGPAGPNGLDGSPGAAGTTGVAGATGAPGATGAQGIQGVKGDTGATGATGAAGVSPIVNRARITTATDGTYTWTYPTACPAGTVPIIQMTPEGSASVTYNTVITAAPTNTSASIKITQVTDVVVLTIHVLGVAPASATVVHLTAVCP